MSSTDDKLVRNCTKTGADALYREMVIGLESFTIKMAGKPSGKLGERCPQRERIVVDSIA